MKIGYARVSTGEQNLDLQRDALKAAQCDQIICDEGISAAHLSRPGFDQVLNLLQPGDTLVVWKMDRAFRSLRHALDVLEHLEQHDIDFTVLTEGIDTSTPMGKCFYQIRNAFAELERNLISERTKAGMAAAKARGVHVGRPPLLSPEQIDWAKDQRKREGRSLRDLADELSVSETTLRNSIYK